MTKDRTGDSWAVGARRQEKTLEVLRDLNRPVRTGELVQVLTIEHEMGKWPQGTYASARNEPYYGGTNQHLGALRRKGHIIQDERGRWVAPSPPDLLPKGDERDLVVNALTEYEERTGLTALIGVSDRLERVIRVQTLRGDIQYELGRWDSWEKGLQSVGLI